MHERDTMSESVVERQLFSKLQIQLPEPPWNLFFAEMFFQVSPGARISPFWGDMLLS